MKKFFSVIFALVSIVLIFALTACDFNRGDQSLTLNHMHKNLQDAGCVDSYIMNGDEESKILLFDIFSDQIGYAYDGELDGALWAEGDDWVVAVFECQGNSDANQLASVANEFKVQNGFYGNEICFSVSGRFFLIGTSAEIIDVALGNKEYSGSNPVVPSNPDVGNEVGELCPSYELEIFDENGLTGLEIDPSKTGKITIINFWGTWCTSCVAELPYFDNVATQYKDDVIVIAVHTAYMFDTAQSYVNDNYSDSDIVFAKDVPTSSDDVYYSTLGGEYGSYPFTVILDENGVITYKNLGSMSESLLVEELEKILNK